VKRITALSCALLLALSARAEEPARQPPVVQGYAFDQPGIMAAQLLWGIAHGARLLALACAQAGHGVAAEAWVDWQERESAQIATLRADLSQHYFQTDDAPPDAVTAALGLKPALALPAEALGPACATLAEALAQPRYDLKKRHEELLKKNE
jgi:malonyl CoA-acyl carrier protein transacylase